MSQQSHSISEVDRGEVAPDLAPSKVQQHQLQLVLAVQVLASALSKDQQQPFQPVLAFQSPESALQAPEPSSGAFPNIGRTRPAFLNTLAGQPLRFQKEIQK